MKRVLGISLVSFLLYAFGAQAGGEGEGIAFYSGSFASAQEQAKQDGKLIFLDAYASWCGPCKYMARTTFQDNRVGAYYNENFVNMKIDMEKGEGPALKEKYGITSYPTFLILDAEGNVVAKLIGYQKVNPFLRWGKAFSSGKG